LKSRYRNTGPPTAVVDAVYDRAQFSCELCSVGLGPMRGRDHHIHHRRARRMGGSQLSDTNLPSNLLLFCTSCHERVEREREAGYAGGWLVHQDDVPAEMPVLIHGRRWVGLTEDGRYLDCDVPEGLSDAS
jgi:hypothetical protein